MTTESEAPAQARLQPAALAEPTTPVQAGWIAALFLANLGVWMGFFTPIQLLLHQQAEAISLERSVGIVATVTGVGALAAIFANPLAGALSDRTSGRAGRRRPWAVGGAVLGAAGLVVLSFQQTVLGLTLCWVGVQICLNAMLAALTAAVPDRVPVRQRGAVSGWMGMPQVLGIVLGIALVTSVFTGIRAGYAAIAVAVVVLSLAFSFLTKEDPLDRADRPRFDLRTFWISPRKHPDFAWAFGTRFLVQLGNSLGTLLLFEFLRDKVKVADPAADQQTLIIIYAVGILATTVVAGRISDRSGRRKGHVITAGVVMAVAALVLAGWPTWTGAMVAAGVMGVGFGIYTAVDQALITQVLPTASGRAKDLGIINIANSAPQVMAPAIAGPVVLSLGGYPVLYAGTAVVTLLGGVLIYKVRSVR